MIEVRELPIGVRLKHPQEDSVDAALEKRQVKRAYKIYAPAYDFVFDWIFHPGREQAIRLLDHPAGRSRPRSRHRHRA